jgi:hypothetical protein
MKFCVESARGWCEGVERLFHIRPFECLIANLHGLMLRNGKADSRKGRLRHQAGRCPKSGFFLRTGMVCRTNNA